MLILADNIRPYGANKEYCKVQPYKAKGSAYPKVQPQHTLYSQSIPKIRKCLTGRSRACAPTEQIKNIVTIPNARKCLTGRSKQIILQKQQTFASVLLLPPLKRSPSLKDGGFCTPKFHKTTKKFASVKSGGAEPAPLQS